MAPDHESVAVAKTRYDATVKALKDAQAKMPSTLTPADSDARKALMRERIEAFNAFRAAEKTLAEEKAHRMEAGLPEEETEDEILLRAMRAADA